MNADTNLGPFGKTDEALARMIKQGYLIKVVEGNGDEQTRDWMVGPRGKVEVGNKGIRELVMAVYGEGAPEDLVKRVKSSLAIQDGVDADSEAREGDEEEQQQPQNEEASGSRRRRRRPAEANDD